LVIWVIWLFVLLVIACFRRQLKWCGLFGLRHLTFWKIRSYFLLKWNTMV